MIWVVPLLIGGAAAGAVMLARSGKKSKRTSGRSSSTTKHPRSMRGRFVLTGEKTTPALRRKAPARGKQSRKAWKPTVMVHSQFGGPDYPAKIVEDIGGGYVQVITKTGSRWEEPKANVRKWKRGDPLEES